MSKIRSIKARRRRLLGVPALVAAAVALVARPAHAATAAEPECAADVIQEA
ncbi:hypothetical protein ACFQY4_12295 [Catellatospora bangladeshensis]|uniref:Uncharacterized protein n=1 Tax=Catellatospora bangladeshensis TaxID=310355 RepID=A0A8J3NMP1_9ACTN|nr:MULTISPECIES: hypothetical protein [Catellatospora]BCJ77293.1 hypothetical protein CS0771_68370 [Catellatospora sp. IY07-71]GIF85243.1 hypothetical protein Cba03nite_65920 [Catellatospora bangladeshensis]